MKRLTISRTSDVPAYIPNEEAVYLHDEFGAKCWQGEAVEILAEYEDSGLTPEGANNIANLLRGHDFPTAALEFLIDAEQEDRLIILPCKAGDTVYYSHAGKVIEKTILCFIKYTHIDDTVAFFDKELTESCEVSNFGKYGYVYLTRQEAEAALLRRVPNQQRY